MPNKSNITPTPYFSPFVAVLIFSISQTKVHCSIPFFLLSKTACAHTCPNRKKSMHCACTPHHGPTTHIHPVYLSIYSVVRCSFSPFLNSSTFSPGGRFLGSPLRRTIAFSFSPSVQPTSLLFSAHHLFVAVLPNCPPSPFLLITLASPPPVFSPIHVFLSCRVVF